SPLEYQPKRLSTSALGPATKPSSDMLMLKVTFCLMRSVQNRPGCSIARRSSREGSTVTGGLRQRRKQILEAVVAGSDAFGHAGVKLRVAGCPVLEPAGYRHNSLACLLRERRRHHGLVLAPGGLVALGVDDAVRWAYLREGAGHAHGAMRVVDPDPVIAAAGAHIHLAGLEAPALRPREPSPHEIRLREGSVDALLRCIENARHLDLDVAGGGYLHGRVRHAG